MKLKITRIILVMSSCGLAAIGAPRQSSLQVKPLCTLLADAPKYDGETITVEGVYLLLPHGAVLTAPDCSLSPRPDANLRLADGFHEKKNRTMQTLWRLSEARKPVDVVLTGTLYVAKPEQGFGQTIEPYEIEVTQFLSARLYVEQQPDKHQP